MSRIGLNYVVASMKFWSHWVFFNGYLRVNFDFPKTLVLSEKMYSGNNSVPQNLVLPHELTDTFLAVFVKS